MTKLNKTYDYGDRFIELSDGTTIEFSHDQECYEDVYADLSSLNDTGFHEDTTITKDNLKIEFVDGYGIRLNGYGIACYDIQNGYYNSDITIIVKNKGEILYKKEFSVWFYGSHFVDEETTRKENY